MRKAMIVVDMIKGFINQETKNGKCALYLKDADSIIPAINEVIASLDEDDLLIFACDCHDHEDKEFERFPPHCIGGTDESLPVDEIDRPKGYFYLPKTRFDAFYETGLDSILKTGTKDRVVDEIVVVGVCTDICVFATAMSASMRDYKVTVPRRCVFPLDKERGEQCLQWLETTAGVVVRGKGPPSTDR